MEMSDTAKLQQIEQLAKEMHGAGHMSRTPEFYAQAIDSILSGNRIFKLAYCAGCRAVVSELEGELCENCNQAYESSQDALAGRN